MQATTSDEAESKSWLERARGWVLRAWLGRVPHLILFLILSAILCAAYFTAHKKWAIAYRESVSNLTVASFQLFQLQKTGDGSKVILAQAGKELRLDEENLPRAPFSLERYDFYRGVLNHYAGVASQISDLYNVRKSSLLQAAQQAGREDVRLPAAFFGDTNNLWLEIPGAAWRDLGSRHLDQFTDTAARIMTAGRAWYPDQKSMLDVQPGERPEVNAAIKLTAENLDPVLRGRSGSLPPESLEASRRFFSSWISDIAVQITAAQTNQTGKPTATLSALLAGESQRLQAQLRQLAHDELGWFWLIGPFRWLEIVFCVWFGVLTVNLIQVMPFVRGTERRVAWESRETWAVFAKIFYAPVLALVVFFLLGFLGFGAAENLEFGRSSLATLSIAFMLGAFPNTAWRLIKDISVRLFRDDIQEGEKKKVVPKAVEVRSQRTQAGARTVYTVEDLKRNAADHLTAIIKPTPKP